MTEKTGFYWEVLEVLQANGFSRPRARAIYLELEEVIEKQLVTGRLHIRGLVTLKVSAQLEKCYNGFTGDSTGRKFVVRAGASVGNRLKEAMTDRAKFGHGICPTCDAVFDDFELLKDHMNEHGKDDRQ